MTTVEEYQGAILKIFENIDESFIAFRGNAHEVCPSYNGPFKSYVHKTSEKQWVLDNLKLQAPIEFEIILHADEYYECQDEFDTLGMQYLHEEFEEMHDPINCGLPVTITIDYEFLNKTENDN